MFGNRRRRATSNPPVNGTNIHPSATSAAAQAFLKNSTSNVSLSAAAAAAAIRSRPTTPTSVADVQTKRTMRRAGSTSSLGSNASSRPQLERRLSNSSMSERSFRDPSPNRSSQPVPSAVDAPPVPAIPQDIPSPAIPAKSHKRAMSLEAPAMRVASPPPNKANGRGSSLGPSGAATVPRRNGQRKGSLSSVSELTGAGRPASRGSVHSVNFSLPTGSRPTSPVYGQRRLTSPSPSRANPPRITSPTNQNLVYDPNTRSFLPAAEILAIEKTLYEVQDAANKPVQKKKRFAPQQATGTHLSDGTIGGRPRGTAIDAMELQSDHPVTNADPIEPKAKPAPIDIPAPISELSASPVPAAVPKKKKKKVAVTSDSDTDQGSYAPNSSDNDSDFTSTNHAQLGPKLTKKPSIVREDREREEEEDSTPQRAKSPDALPKLDTVPRPISPTPSPRSAGRGHGKGQASASAAFAQQRQHTRSASQPAPSSPESPVEESIAPLAAKGSIRGGRVHSVSPARIAHFGGATDTLQVKHNPPPRSISPRKSAMKHPSTPRGTSPNGSEGVGVAQTTSDVEELSVPRKKANRVSFDESNVVVGQAATTVPTDSPMVQSPQTKRPWYSIGRGKKKDAPPVDDEDEIMQPRPALPSFGSVRTKKEKPQEEKERPLVKPAAPTTEILPQSILKSQPEERMELPLGQSNDHIIGSVLSQDAERNAANISRSREPLPPQVTSVEGSGYTSDDSSSVASLKESAIAAAAIENGAHTPIVDDDDADTTPRGGPTPIPEEREEEEKQDKINGDVPAIAVSQATPTLDETASRTEWPDMPGGWRNSSTSEDSNSQARDDSSTAEETQVGDITPAEAGITEPDPSTPRAGSPILGEIAAENVNSHAHPIILEEPEESDASIYSDAAEELTDTEGDGFMSLDAVAVSPVVPNVSGLISLPEPESPTPKAIKEKAYKQSQAQRNSNEPNADEGWAKAQEYWKSLSVDKKRELEEQARIGADAEDEGSDTETETKPAPKPKKKKKVTVVPVIPSQPPNPKNSDRSYMITPGTKAGPNGHAAMRSSMRAEPVAIPSDTTIRKSMRGSQVSKHDSLRASAPPEARGALQKKHRPLSAPVTEYGADPALVEDLVKKMTKAKAANASAAATKTSSTQRTAPTLRRKGSGDSDSSFKRARSGSNSAVPSFRRSMRSTDEPVTNGRHSSPMESSRFSIRSLSPTGSVARRPFNSSSATAVNSNPTHMRMSMRNSGASGYTPTMRGNSTASRAKSPTRILGFGRTSSSKPAGPSKTFKRSSRFADSSDEEDARPGFRSRFVDSSDDDDDEPLPRPQRGLASKSMRAAPAPSAPSRVVPKRVEAQDGDSSDLPDSDDEKPKPQASKNPATNGTTAATKEGTTLSTGSLRRSGSGRGAISPSTAPTRPQHQRRGSLMSILRRKKVDPSSKVRKSELESAARRDTPLERSKSDLQNLRGPSSPKLQKRNPMSRENSTSWPLTPPPKVTGDDARPFSADAGNGVSASASARPDMGERRFTATGLSDVDMSTIVTPRKKKKFGTLRRMFRLDD